MLVAPVTTAVRLTDWPRMSVAIGGVTVTETTLAPLLLLPQPLEKSKQSPAIPAPANFKAGCNFTPTISPTLSPPHGVSPGLARLFLTNTLFHSHKTQLPGVPALLERPAHGEAERRLGFEIIRPRGSAERRHTHVSGAGAVLRPQGKVSPGAVPDA